MPLRYDYERAIIGDPGEVECEACGGDPLVELTTRGTDGEHASASLCEDCLVGWLRGTVRGVMARVRERRREKEQQEQAEVGEE